MFWILHGLFKCIKIIKFKRYIKKVIRISVLNTSSIFQTFKFTKFKRNFKKVNRIYVLDSLRIV